MNFGYGIRVREVRDVMEEDPYRCGYRERRDESRLRGEEESEGYTTYRDGPDVAGREAGYSRRYIVAGFLDDRRLRRAADIGKGKPFPDEVEFDRLPLVDELVRVALDPVPADDVP